MCAPCKMCVLHVKCVSCFFELQGDFFCCKCSETTSAAQWYRHDIGLHTRQLLSQMQRKSVRCLSLYVCVRARVCVSTYFTDIAKVLRTTPNLRCLSMEFVCSEQCVQVHKHICTHLHTHTHPHTHVRTHTHIHTR